MSWPANRTLQLFASPEFSNEKQQVHVSKPSFSGRLNLQEIWLPRNISVDTKIYGSEKAVLNTLIEVYGENDGIDAGKRLAINSWLSPDVFRKTSLLGKYGDLTAEYYPQKDFAKFMSITIADEMQGQDLGKLLTSNGLNILQAFNPKVLEIEDVVSIPSYNLFTGILGEGSFENGMSKEDGIDAIIHSTQKPSIFYDYNQLQ